MQLLDVPQQFFCSEEEIIRLPTRIIQVASLAFCTGHPLGHRITVYRSTAGGEYQYSDVSDLSLHFRTLSCIRHSFILLSFRVIFSKRSLTNNSTTETSPKTVFIVSKSFFNH